MRVSDIRKRYPDFFATVEAAVWDDAGESFRGRDMWPDWPKIRNRIAYNAAAIATLELHKISSKKKIIIKGGTDGRK